MTSSSSCLHVQAVNIGPVPWSGGDLLSGQLLQNLAHQAHLVQGQLVLPGRALHDGRQEGLRVEEARQPDGGGEVEVVGPPFPAS